MTKPYLLITNDDGITAPGIKHLWQAVQEFAETIVVAPISEKSGSGVSITWVKPLRVHPFAWENDTPAWSVSGTPVDCVKMGLNVILPKKPDMIISGVNRGSNAGRTVLYSGTVGGCIDGALKGIPAIAFSFSDFEPPPVEATKNYIFPLIAHFLKHPLPQGTFLNVNFPYNAKDKIAGLRFAKQGRSYWMESPDKRLHPEGMPYYWLGGVWGEVAEDPESDVALLAQGYITVVPIHVDQLTCHNSYQKHKNLTEKSLNLHTPLSKSL